MFKKPYNPGLTSFLQATGIIAYISLVAVVFSKGNEWFGPQTNTYLGPLLVITLFAVSALICAILTLGYPFLLFWEHKKTKKAIEVVILTALWLILFILGIIIYILSF